MTKKKSATKACAACGGTLSVQPQESARAGIVTCRSGTVDAEAGLPWNCLFSQPTLSDDTRHAMDLIVQKPTSYGAKAAKRNENRREILLSYIRDVHEGEPSLVWYRAVLKGYCPILVKNALSTMPYRQNPDLRFDTIAVLGTIDRQIEKLRANTNDHYTELVSGFLDSRYELMHFGFDHGLFGSKNPVKIYTVCREINLIARYLEWVHAKGHATLQDAGRMVFDEYVADVDSLAAHAYTLNRFYRWAKKKYPFITDVDFHRRGKGTRSTGFKTLDLDESKVAFQRICQYPDPRGRAIALLCLLYAQQVSSSVSLRRDELVRDVDADRWTIARHDAEEAYLVEPELSEAIDECLTGGWGGGARRAEGDTSDYVFVGASSGHMSVSWAFSLVREASGTLSGVLRRTGIINMYRGGQKTMGTVVLRDILKVSRPTLQKAIRATGESVNTPTTRQEADALRRAFLDDDADD